MRAKLMPKFLPVYDDEFSYLPDKIRVSTEDGHVVDYVLAERHPGPPVLAGMLREFDRKVFGKNCEGRKDNE